MGTFNSSQIGILQTVCNKYNPGKQVFKLQAINGTLNNTNEVTTENINTTNIMNKHPEALGISTVKSSVCIKLEVPSYIVKDYPTKYIPQGTRFIINYQNGDISKPIVTGVEP